MQALVLHVHTSNKSAHISGYKCIDQLVSPFCRVFGFGTYGDVVENSLGGNKTKQHTSRFLLCITVYADYCTVNMWNKIHKICVGKFIKMSTDTSYYI